MPNIADGKAFSWSIDGNKLVLGREGESNIPAVVANIEVGWCVHALAQGACLLISLSLSLPLKPRPTSSSLLPLPVCVCVSARACVGVGA